ncbi:hypothetical protein NP233_g6546 [Leucocoprinus birnbaumii]|uniref:Spc7 kinetochore protein domain-containing protein n=1 Tax=Leucocoprinus birnbaumii TaxID=56174 RepID=A0AAD5VUC5_9AGAR|nr:hypothetical protein NP233_g6546 [Leucocoprinus birnbaumii]
MAVLKEDSSKRRRSIAVPSSSKHAITAPTGRRRAHSIVPGEQLSGLDKARRPSFAPRKSILKTSALVNTDEASEQLSQPSNSQSSQVDDVTQSMDFTVDYRARLHDNTSRKSLGRRVSFAEHAHVRLFQIPNHDNTNSTGSPQSSPIPSSSPEIDQPPTLSNENDYPASFSRRRRSSIRNSMAGSEDMDLTTASPGLILDDEGGSALLDEEMDFDDQDDMDVTEVVKGDMLRRRSLGVRQPFAPVQPRESIVFPSDDAIPSDDEVGLTHDNDQSRSMLEDDSQVQSEVENSQAGMEFTVPMGQSLRPPPTEDPAWLALRQMTHSGNTPHEPEVPSEDDIHVNSGQQGMDLEDAMARLMRARDSMGANTTDATEDMEMTNAHPNFAVHEDSLLSTDDSLNDEMGDGNETLNISKVVGRLSLGGDARMSLGYQESTMDESGIYGSMQPLSSSTPRHSIAPSLETQQGREEGEETAPEIQVNNDSDTTPRPVVFHPPAPATSAPQIVTSTATPIPNQPQVTSTFTFVPPTAAPAVPRTPTKPTSPVKPKPKPTFSAAFAPPVTKPSPKKPTSSSTPSNETPNKRPFSVMQDGAHDSGRPSPAKRLALSQRPNERPSMGTPRKGPASLQHRGSASPDKRSASSGSTNLSVPPRRQSGYFARRKSLGNALVAPQNEQSNSNLALNPSSPARRISNGRSSLGSASSEAWARFDKNAPPPTVPTIVLPPEEPQLGAPSDQPLRPSSSPGPSRVPRSTTPTPSDIPEHVETQPMDMDQDQDAGTAVAQPEEETQPEDEDVPSISIQQFFSLTGIKFMDELTAPRRSMHPGISTRQTRNPEDIPLAEYYTAMGIDVPQLGLFTRVSKDLEGWMARSKAEFAQAEDEAAKMTPELFVEFMRADEEGQAELLASSITWLRGHPTQWQAKSDWYDWKLRWVEGLQSTAEQAFSDLQADARILEPLKKSAEELVPTLEKEYYEILQELEREQAEVAEIEASDQEYLNDLKVSIAEQNIEVEALRAELSEHTEQLNYLQGRLQELAIGKKEASDAITKAQHVLQMKENSTRTEVFRLRDELETLEDLHRFHIKKVSENMLEYIYASHFRVTIPCNNYLPIASRVDISRIDGPGLRTKDDFPKLSQLLLQAAKVLIHHTQPISCKEIIQYLSDYWSSCSQLRAQLFLLAIKYPVDILPMDCEGSPGFKARTKVMIPSKKAKVFVTFNFTPEIFSRWPLSINSLNCEVAVQYGDVSKTTISQAVSERLSQATASDNYACLLDACIEAQEIYNH